MIAEHPLEARVRQHLLGLGLGDGQRSVLVAVSGGCDSVVLLYLLRFPLRDLRLSVTAAHLDHAMRDDSVADARWVRGLCRAWEVELEVERLPRPPSSEGAARSARYNFLRRVAEARGRALIATAHHADDQAETVLFRAVRGTGLKGLAGIAPLADGVLRPLLMVWRREIEAYARLRGLVWRTDVTNAELNPVRNRIRHEVLPLLERRVSPSARRSLVSLAAIAAEAESALERISAAAEADLVRWEGDTPSLARHRLPLYDSAITSRVVRNLLRRFGVVLGRTGTRRALQFITDAKSGRQMPISRDLRIEVEFDRALFRREAEPPDDEHFEISAAAPSSEGQVRIGGVVYHLHFSTAEGPEPSGDVQAMWHFRAPRERLAFPLRIRGWQPGDRLSRGERRRSLKRVFLERRVPRERRRQIPLLVDARGDVLWVAGVTAGGVTGSSEFGESFILRLQHD